MSEPIDVALVDAATVVVVRDGEPAASPGHGFERAASDAAAHLEVLMLRRNSRGFFGGMWVFPGGRVDPPDRDVPGDVVGPCDPRTGFAHSNDARGYRTAAIREAREEAGIDLSGCELTHFAHWLPPQIRAKRFSTHFFICEAPADLGQVHVDGSEILDFAWVSPAAALKRRAAGDIEFVTPTFVTLTWLSGFGASADALASVDAHTCFHTAIIPSPEPDPGNVAVYVGDAAYPDGDLDAPGPRRRCAMVRSGWRWEEHDGNVTG
ncbi:NUDIX hydrolase [Candidatus Poriferisodalis sp.]|uniref:NUDIX hydrolase n=1 Tax=Candidatus Poriferisodalis sp. TaxID=3101277 RepID=UPI003B022DF8